VGKLYKFNNNEDEECMCPFCELAQEFTSYIAEAESYEEILNILRDLVAESSKLGLIQYLQQEISHNADLLDHLIYSCNDEDLN
jgi:hypothetical protein